MKLTQYIADLLHKNNCVIVPDFGGFIANYQPAVIDELRQKIYPPSKHVLFNNNLISNDGLLANFVAQKINTTYTNALSQINADVEQWKIDLLKGKRIEIGEIGFLYSENQQLKFEQNKSYNLLLSAYGLSEIKFITPIEDKKEIQPHQKVTVRTKKVERPKKQKTSIKALPIQDAVIQVESTEKQKSTLNQVVHFGPKKRKKNWKYMVAACALPLLFYSYWIPMNTNVLETGNVKISDFNPFGHQVNKSYSKRDNTSFKEIEPQTNKTWSDLIENINPNVNVYNYQLDEDLYIPVLLSNSVDGVSNLTSDFIEEVNDNNVDTVLEPLNETVNAISSNKNIHLISGCFSEKHNADVFVKELKSKGYPAHIVDKNKGLYRVSAQSFKYKSEAKSFKNKLSNDGYSSWILKK
jgi:cell division protein FtsN